MSFNVISEDGLASAGHTMSSMEILTKNSLTSAGVILGAGTGVAGAALLTAALPAQMLLATGTTAALLYAGDRKSKDLPVFPWGAAPAAPVMSDDYDHTAGVDVEATAV